MRVLRSVGVGLAVGIGLGMFATGPGVLAAAGMNEARTEAIRPDPADARAWNSRGVRLERAGRHREAIADLDRAIRLNPTLASAYQNRGAAYNGLGQFERALRDLDEAIRLDPSRAGAHNNRGLALWALGRADEAIEALGRAVALDPANPLIRLSRAEAHAQLGQLDRAVIDFDDAIRLNPSLAGAYVGRGNIRLALGLASQAAADYQAAARLAPRDAGLACNLGNAHRVMGDWQAALADFDRAIQLNPNHADAYLARGWIRLVLDRDGADADARAFLNLDRWQGPHATDMALLGALGARRAGREADARRLLDEAEAHARPHAWPYPVIGYLKGERSARDLLQNAGGEAQATEARLFVALDRLLAGDRPEALENLHWIRDHGARDSMAMDLARAVLRRVEAAGEPGPSPRLTRGESN